MKNYLLLLIISVFLSGCKGIEFRDNWDLDIRPRGNPKSVEILTYSGNLKNDSIVKNKLIMREAITFTKNRKIMTLNHYGSNGNLMPYGREYKFHHGNPVQEIVYNAYNKIPESIRDNTFNRKGQIVKCVKSKAAKVVETDTFLYGKSNSNITVIKDYGQGKSSKEIYDYDRKRRITKFSSFGEDGNFHHGTDYFYDDKKKVNIEKWLNDKNEVTLYLRNKLNKYGDIILQEDFEIKEKDTIVTYSSSCVSLYDKRKNIIKDITNENGKQFSITEYNYSYY